MVHLAILEARHHLSVDRIDDATRGAMFAMAEQSYSGDLLDAGKVGIERPFNWQLSRRVCVSLTYDGPEGHVAECYEVVRPDLYEGPKWSPDEQSLCGLCGLRVCHDTENLVLTNRKLVIVWAGDGGRHGAGEDKKRKTSQQEIKLL